MDEKTMTAEPSSLDRLHQSLNTELTRTVITYKNPHKLIAISKLKQLAKEASWIAFLLEDGGRVAAGSRIPKFIKKLNRLTRYAIKHGLLKEAPTLTYAATITNGYLKPLDDNTYSAVTLAAILEREHNPDRMLAGLIISWGKQTTPKIIPDHVQP